MKKFFFQLSIGVALLLMFCTLATLSAREPVSVILDTDLGNDIDDVLALAMLHSFQSRSECDLLGVTVTKDNKYVAPYVRMINEFYGYPNIPVGSIHSGITPKDGNYLRLLLEARDAKGNLRFAPFDVATDKTVYPDSCKLLRKLLAESKKKVVVVQIGFSTNLARLIDTKADEYSPLTGKELMKEKVEYICAMAGEFAPPHEKRMKSEYNVECDIPSAQKLFAESPVPILCSGFEIGIQIAHPGLSIQEDLDYVPNHPIKESYRLYKGGFDKDALTWDLTCVLQAVRPNRGYFDLSAPGTITIDEKGGSTFQLDSKGRHRIFLINEKQIEKVKEAFINLVSEPPKSLSSR